MVAEGFDALFNPPPLNVVPFVLGAQSEVEEGLLVSAGKSRNLAVVDNVEAPSPDPLDHLRAPPIRALTPPLWGRSVKITRDDDPGFSTLLPDGGVESIQE